MTGHDMRGRCVDAHSLSQTRISADLSEKSGGGEGDRTLDLRIANATLSQLSYSPGKGGEYYQQSAISQSAP